MVTIYYYIPHAGKEKKEVNGLQQIALKLLASDRGKFFILILGITFAVFLMMQMTAIFAGVMNRTAANIFNLNAKVWVMDPSVNTQADNIPLPNYVLDMVRSVKGVAYAAPVYSGNGLVKLPNGRYQAVTIIGLDDVSLLGRPKLLAGIPADIYNNNAYFVVKDAEYKKLDSPKIGETFEINDHQATVVGLGSALVSGLFGSPTLYTTYTRAITSLPPTRFTISYILVIPKHEGDIPYIQNAVKKMGYLALTQQQFVSKNTDYYLYHTGLGANLLIMTTISFIVGLSIAGQTFYMFVLENMEKFGALRAIGAKKLELIKIILFQSSIVGFLGYGFGVLLSSLLIAIAKLKLPYYASLVTYKNLTISFLVVLTIVAFSSYLGIRKVIKVEPFNVFRG
jgi:putative ABC transport system permease protein